MAKQQLPLPMPSGGGGGVLKKVVGFGFAIAVLMMVIKQPEQSAQLVQDGFSTAGTAIDGLTMFLTSLGS